MRLVGIRRIPSGGYVLNLLDMDNRNNYYLLLIDAKAGDEDLESVVYMEKTFRLGGEYDLLDIFENVHEEEEV